MSTDKADTDVPSPVGGVVRAVLANEQDVVPVDRAILEIDTDASAAAPAPAPVAAAAPAAAPVTAPITPKVRSMAREHDLDLATVQGTGERGRVTPRDVEAAVEARASKPAAPAPVAAAPVAPAPVAAAPAPSGGRANLLADIQRGKELKSVDSGSLPELDNMSEEGRGNLANTLANALALRRADMVASDHEEDAGGWDEWDEDM